MLVDLCVCTRAKTSIVIFALGLLVVREQIFLLKGRLEICCKHWPSPRNMRQRDTYCRIQNVILFHWYPWWIRFTSVDNCNNRAHAQVWERNAHSKLVTNFEQLTNGRSKNSKKSEILFGGRFISLLQFIMYWSYWYYISSNTVFNSCGKMRFCINPYFEHLILCFYKHECVYVSRWAKTLQSTTHSNTNKCCRLPEVH